ncbi:hypothetical protein ACQEVF_44030 [Nonomuraea polychroma]
MTVTVALAVAVFLGIYTLIATEKIPQVAAALGRATGHPRHRRRGGVLL